MCGVRSRDSWLLASGEWQQLEENYKGGFWGPGNVPFFDLGAGYMGVFTIRKLTEL